jgi:signal transduction histidine kinase
VRLPRLTSIEPADLALAIVLAVVTAVETASKGGDDVVLRAGLASATVLSLALRRTMPSLMALGFAGGMALESLITESPDEMGVLIGCMIAAFSVAGYAATREGILGVGLLSLAVSVVIAVDPSDEVGNIPPTLVLFVWLPAAVGFGWAQRGSNLRALTLRAESAELEAEAAVEAERRRVARELHDVVSHAVTVIAVQAAAGQATLASDPAASGRSLSAIAESSRDALDELHALLGLLREPAEPPTPRGLAQLGTLVETVRAAGVSVELHDNSDSVRLTEAADHIAYRVLQEGLTNALRHARSPHAVLRIGVLAEQATVQVVSTGTHHGSTYGGHGSGIEGLRERVTALGGVLDASVAGDTFTLSATIPVSAT